jgi:uncharacterized membrane protein YbhN (UPF0104 family)
VSRKHALSVAAGLGGTGFFLWLAVRNVSLVALRRALAGASWGWLIPMGAIVFLDLLVRAARWRVLLSRARPDAPVLELARLEAIGLGINNVLFLRLGELARAGLAARRLGMSAAASLASVVVERALDVAALLTIFLIASGMETGFAPSAMRRLAGLVLAAAVAALAALAFAESSVEKGGIAERALRRWPKAHALVAQLALGAAVLRRPGAAARAAAWSLALWSVDAGVYWAGARALGLGGIMNYPRAVLALSWAGASSALPAAPGAIGTFEAVVKSIVVQFGATPDQAFAYALVCHMVMYLLVTLAGLAFLYRVGVSLADLRGETARR